MGAWGHGIKPPIVSPRLGTLDLPYPKPTMADTIALYIVRSTYLIIYVFHG